MYVCIEWWCSFEIVLLNFTAIFAWGTFRLRFLCIDESRIRLQPMNLCHWIFVTVKQLTCNLNRSMVLIISVSANRTFFFITVILSSGNSRHCCALDLRMNTGGWRRNGNVMWLFKLDALTPGNWWALGQVCLGGKMQQCPSTLRLSFWTSLMEQFLALDFCLEIMYIITSEPMQKQLSAWVLFWAEQTQWLCVNTD